MAAIPDAMAPHGCVENQFADDLSDARRNVIAAHPAESDQDRLLQSAVAGFLIQQGSRSPRCYSTTSTACSRGPAWPLVEGEAPPGLRGACGCHPGWKQLRVGMLSPEASALGSPG